jgi:hypothetical protein
MGSYARVDYNLTKENKIFLIYKDIQMGSEKVFLINEEMGKFFPIYEEAVSHTVYDLAPDPLLISLHMRKIFFFFFQCGTLYAGVDYNLTITSRVEKWDYMNRRNRGRVQRITLYMGPYAGVDYILTCGHVGLHKHRWNRGRIQRKIWDPVPELTITLTLCPLQSRLQHI